MAGHRMRVSHRRKGSTPFTNWRGNSGASKNGMIFAAASPSTPASLKAALAPTSFRNAPAQIENSAGAFRNDVGASAAFNDAGVDGEAAAKIIPFFDAPELPRQFVNGVDPFLRCETRMRCPAMND